MVCAGFCRKITCRRRFCCNRVWRCGDGADGWNHGSRGPFDEREMEKRLTSDTLLIDATHPYAAAVTDNLRAACAKSGARYERLLRPALPYQNCEIVLDTAAAVDWLNAHPGKVLLTTGSKELEAYTAVQDFKRACSRACCRPRRCLKSAPHSASRARTSSPCRGPFFAGDERGAAARDRRKKSS